MCSVDKSYDKDWSVKSDDQGWSVVVKRAKSKTDMRPARGQMINYVGKGNDEGQIGSVEEFKGAWERTAVKIDSGAIDTVTPPSTANEFKLRETEASRMGLTYQPMAAR